MIDSIFPNYFYSLITPPNKEELITTLNNVEVDESESKELLWANHCKIKVDSLYPQDVKSALTQTLNIFSNELGVNFDKLKMLGVWRNTYNKGYYQEIHDHVAHDGADLSGVVFLTDHVEGASKFYFFNKHYSEMSTFWIRLLNDTKATYRTYSIIPKVGDVLLFPSYMMHGVTMHKIDQPRTTVAFNISLQ